MMASRRTAPGGAEDCDDANSQVYPGANELENGVDDNCDGVIDASVPTPTPEETPTPGPNPEETPTPTLEETPTPMPEETSTPTPEETSSPGPSPEVTPTPGSTPDCETLGTCEESGSCACTHEETPPPLAPASVLAFALAGTRRTTQALRLPTAASECACGLKSQLRRNSSRPGLTWPAPDCGPSSKPSGPDRWCNW